MVDLVVNASFDYSSSALLDITRIKFTAGDVVATFDASQFDDTAIHDNLIVRGYSGVGSGGLLINGGGVDASGWTFNLWDRAVDTLTFYGTALADNYNGSVMKDVMFGGQGSDTFNTSDGGGDEFHGEGGKDYFRYKSVAGPIIDHIDGGGSGGDRLSVGGGGTFDFTGASIISVEELRFGNASQTVVLNYDQIYPFLAGSINTITGSSAANTLEIHGTSASFGNITVSNWTDGVDKFRIVGTSGQDLLFGSIYGDEIVSGGGNDVIDAGNGDDTVEIDALIDAANIEGGQGSDTLLLTVSAVPFITELDLTTSTVSGFERLVFAGQYEQYLLLDSQFFIENPLSEVASNGWFNQLHIFGNSVNLNGIAFSGWGNAPVKIRLFGSGDDHFDTSGLETDDRADVHGGLADVRLGGANDTVVLYDQLDAGSILDGGANDTSFGDDLFIESSAPVLLDLTSISILGFETVGTDIGYNGTVIMSGDQIGGASGATNLYMFDSAGATLNVVGSLVDLSNVVMGRIHSTDTIIIDGTTGDDVLIGSSEADILNGDIGRDTFTIWGADEANGEGANDTFIVDTVNYGNTFTGIINGGAGTADAIVVSGFAFLTEADISNIEVLHSQGGFHWLRGDHFGAAGISTIELDVGASIEFFIEGTTIDLGGVALVNFGTAPIQRIKLFGTEANDTAIGTYGDDYLFGSIGADTLDGGDGVDVVDYNLSSDGVTVKLNNGTFAGGDAEGDVLSNIENIVGSWHDDTLTGDSGDNEIQGNDGDDVITGGNGTDLLFGGDGNDTFGYSGTGQSGLGALSDVIVDFSQSVGDDDLIQVSAIDAMESTAGVDDAFTYIGQDAFTAEGQIRSFQSGTRTIVLFNTSGTDDAEMRIILENVTATNLSAADFTL
ncbi:MAG TPA: calcium-binding protein [Aestuariivirga sp.]|nr:calcium-binding protein [Aestuariivirga sp.]